MHGGIMSKQRYLTKSRFKLATECPTKLFYTAKKSEYANQQLEDSFLQALAEGGFQVGELAKCYFPNGHDIKSLDYDEALDQTNELLKQENVVIYEAAISFEYLFIRADILVKKGNRIQLYEVKAKSFDPSTDLFFSKKGSLVSTWQPYLYDVAFQKYVISRALPNYDISAYLMLVDKTSIAPTDGLNQKFKLVKNNGRTSVEISDQLTALDLTPEILCKINVKDACDFIYAQHDFGNDKNLTFTNMIQQYSEKYALDEKIISPISPACGKCEFDTKDGEQNHLKSGKKECWKEQLGWNDKDFEAQTIFDVWDFRKKDECLEQGIIKMNYVNEELVNPTPDGKAGLSSSERRWLQIEKYTRACPHLSFF